MKTNLSCLAGAALATACLALAGCATPGGQEDAAAIAADEAAGQSIAGTWRVIASHVGAGGALSAAQAAAYEGRDVILGPDEVVSVLGNRCPLPHFTTASLAPGASFFDTGLTPEALGYSPDQVEVVTVTCGAEDDPFDHFVRLGDDTLLTGFSGAVFALEPFEVPAAPPTESIAGTAIASSRAAGPAPPLPTSQGPATPATEQPPAGIAAGAIAAAPASPPARAPDTGTGTGQETGRSEPAQQAPARLSGPGAHVASYRNDADAREGWRVLSTSFPSLAALSPVIVNADLGDRGVFRRLIGLGRDQQAVDAVCAELNRSAPSSCRVVTVTTADGARAIAGTTAPVQPPNAPAPQPAAATPAPVPATAVAAASPEASRTAGGAVPSADALMGVWGINLAEACDGGETIAFYPEGTVSLFGTMDGTWSLNGSQVDMVLTAYDESGAPTQRNIDAVLTLDLLQPALFVGALTANQRTARITGHACP